MNENILYNILGIPQDIGELTKQKLNMFYVKRKKNLRLKVKNTKLDNFILSFRNLCYFLDINDAGCDYMIECGFDLNSILNFDEMSLYSRQVQGNELFEKSLALVNFAKDELMHTLSGGISNFLDNLNTHSEPDIFNQQSNQGVWVTEEFFTYPQLVYPNPTNGEDFITLGITDINKKTLKSSDGIHLQVDFGNNREENLEFTLMEGMQENDVLISRAVILKNRNNVIANADKGGFKRAYVSNLVLSSR